MILANARGVYTPADRTVVFAIPDAAVKGTMLVALLAHDATESVATPDGWTSLGQLGVSLTTLSVYARMVEGVETEITFTIGSASTKEWLGELLVCRGGSPTIIKEAAATATFTATTALTTAGVTSQQAVSLILGVWSAAGAVTMTPPTGFTSLDAFSSAVSTSRSILFAYRVAGITGALTFTTATASGNATGASFIHILRSRVPIQPAAMVDAIPGNIGLL